MKKHKAIYLGDSLEPLNKLLNNGWVVKSTTSRSISTSITGSSYNRDTVEGKILVILEKDEPKETKESTESSHHPLHEMSEAWSKWNPIKELSNLFGSKND